MQTLAVGTYKKFCDCKQMFIMEGVEDATCDWGLGHYEISLYTCYQCGDGKWEELPAREHYHMRKMDMLLIVPSHGFQKSLLIVI